MENETIKLSIDVELTRCMLENPPPPDAEGGKTVGHMHMMATTAKITHKGQFYGEIGMDLGAAVVMEIEDVQYHIEGLRLWEAVRGALAQVKA